MRNSGALVVACGGGKGGAGKSLVAANLGIAIARLGMRTVLVDADLGGANLHTMFGIDQPGATLGALIDRRASSLEDVSIPTGEPRLFLVPGTGAIVGSANLGHAQKTKLLGHIRRIDAEVVIVDVGAGVAFNTLDLFDVGDVRLVVATPQLTSLQNAYAFTKGAVYRGLRAAARDDEEREQLSGASDRTETERVGHTIARVDQSDPQLAGRMRRIIEGFGGAIVGNQLEGTSQRNVLFGLSRMARDFLGVALPVVAELPLDSQLHRSVTDRRPYLLTHPATKLAHAFRELAEQIATTDLSALREARELQEFGSVPTSAEAAFGETLRPYLRREPRVAVDWPATARTAADCAVGRVVDVSLRGALVATPLRLERGARVELRIQRYAEPFHGVVRHVRPGYLGVEFDVAHEAPVSDASAPLRRGRHETPNRLSTAR